MKNREPLIYGCLSVVLFLLAWQLLIVTGIVDQQFLASPTQVLSRLGEMSSSGMLWNDLAVSGSEFAVGFGLAILVGVPLGIAMGWYRIFRMLMSPLVSALYSTPRVALLPLFVIWFGLGMSSKIIVIFVVVVFTIVLSTEAGVRSVDKDYVETAKCFGASDLQLFRGIVLPATVPHLFGGLKLAVGQALIGVVTAELYAATAGIGYRIVISGQQFDTTSALAGVMVLTFCAVMLISLLGAIAARFDSWRIQ